MAFSEEIFTAKTPRHQVFIKNPLLNIAWGWRTPRRGGPLCVVCQQVLRRIVGGRKVGVGRWVGGERDAGEIRSYGIGYRNAEQNQRTDDKAREHSLNCKQDSTAFRIKSKVPRKK